MSCIYGIEQLCSECRMCQSKEEQTSTETAKETKDDLISRKALISHIESEYRQWGEDYDVEQILGDIEDFSTAYDVDKIIEQQSTETNNKAILVIDMPKSCEECPMIIYGEECILQDKDTNFSDITWDELRESCPLKAIPSKRNIETTQNKEYIRGWNACVDAIL